MNKKCIEQALDWDIANLSATIRKKEISPVEITEKMLERITEKNEHINAYITVRCAMCYLEELAITQHYEWFSGCFQKRIKI